MDWRCLAAVVVGVTVGCQTERPGLAGVEGGKPPIPGGLLQLRESSPSAPSTSRLQKPDDPDAVPVSTASFLDRTVSAGSSEDQVISTIRATVNGAPILDSEVRNACFYLLQQLQSLPAGEREAREKEILDKTLDALIERELVLQEANARFGGKNASKFMDKLKEAADKEFDRQILRSLKAQHGIKNDEEFKARLKAQGTSLTGLRKQFEKQFIYQEYLRFKAGPELDRIGHLQLLDYYNSHPDEFQTVDSVDWQDLFVANARHPSRDAARQFAEQLRQRVIRGEDFVKLVKEYDNGDAIYRNGGGFGSKRGEIKPPEAEPVLFALKDGEVGPLVELSNGFHIVRVVKREHAGKTPFDAKTQGKIRDKLRVDIFTRVSKRVVAELRRQAAIDIAGQPEK